MGKGIMGQRKSQFASRSVAAATRGKVKLGGKITEMLKLRTEYDLRMMKRKIWADIER